MGLREAIRAIAKWRYASRYRAAVMKDITVATAYGDLQDKQWWNQESQGGRLTVTPDGFAYPTGLQYQILTYIYLKRKPTGDEHVLQARIEVESIRTLQEVVAKLKRDGIKMDATDAVGWQLGAELSKSLIKDLEGVAPHQVVEALKLWAERREHKHVAAVWLLFKVTRHASEKFGLALANILEKTAKGAEEVGYSSMSSARNDDGETSVGGPPKHENDSKPKSFLSVLLQGLDKFDVLRLILEGAYNREGLEAMFGVGWLNDLPDNERYAVNRVKIESLAHIFHHGIEGVFPVGEGTYEARIECSSIERELPDGQEGGLRPMLGGDALWSITHLYLEALNNREAILLDVEEFWYPNHWPAPPEGLTWQWEDFGWVRRDCIFRKLRYPGSEVIADFSLPGERESEG